MPMASDIKPGDWLLRSLIYGPAKTKKTWWALRCAQLGYNVIHLDGDGYGSMIARQLPIEAQRRITVVDLTMKPDRTIFAPFLAMILRQKNFRHIWDEQDKASVFGLANVEHSHLKIDITQLTSNDVFVLDSWDKLAESTLFEFAAEHQIDLSDAEKTEWKGYNYQGNFLNWIIARIKSLPCQVIVIAHATVYEKWDRSNPDPRMHRMVEQRTQPVSSSGPHAKKLAAEFTDVLYFTKLSSQAFRIDTAGDRDRDGGSRLLPPGSYDWNEFGPEKCLDALGMKPTGEPCKGFQAFKSGEEVPRGWVAQAGPLVSVASSNEPVARPVPPVIINEGGSLMARLASQKKGG